MAETSINGRSVADVMSRKNEIMRASMGIDYTPYAYGTVGFDYERFLDDTGYTVDRVREIQSQTAVGNTPLVELRNVTELVRSVSAPGKGARVIVKDEAANPSGSFKDRRASLSAYEARERGYPGIAAASSGNYGAAVASQAAKLRLGAIIVQEVFDSAFREQPEISEKTRACEAYGAEVIRLSVGPELFSVYLLVLEETGYFNASLYSPYSILGIETLGQEIADQMRALTGAPPDVVIATHAGGGNLTGTARGLRAAGATDTVMIGASVDLSGLHMASDRDFNRKSFTTGHTGFSFPFTTWPDRSDVPRSAARPLRYLDRFVTVTQGEVFYATQMLAEVEGMERGPAGNTSLAAAVSIARELRSDQTVVVQETEYTGAGKHPFSQLNFARRMGVAVRRGDPRESVPGESIVVPQRLEQFAAVDVDLDALRRSYLKRVQESLAVQGDSATALGAEDIRFLAEETRLSEDRVIHMLKEIEQT